MPKQIPANNQNPSRRTPGPSASAMGSLSSSVEEQQAQLVSAQPNIDQSQVNTGTTKFGQGANQIGGVSIYSQLADLLNTGMQVASTAVETANYYATTQDEQTADQMQEDMNSLETKRKDQEMSELEYTQQRALLLETYQSQYTTRAFRKPMEQSIFENSMARQDAPLNDQITEYKRNQLRISRDPSYAAEGEMGEIRRAEDLNELNTIFYNMMEGHFGQSEDDMTRVRGAMGEYRDQSNKVVNLATRTLRRHEDKIDDAIASIVGSMSGGFDRTSVRYDSPAEMASDVLLQSGLPQEIIDNSGGMLEAEFMKQFNYKIKKAYDVEMKNVNTAIKDNLTTRAEGALTRAQNLAADGNDPTPDLDSFEEDIVDAFFMTEDEDLARSTLNEHLSKLAGVLKDTTYGTPREVQAAILARLSAVIEQTGGGTLKEDYSVYATLAGDKNLSQFDHFDGYTNDPASLRGVVRSPSTTPHTQNLKYEAIASAVEVGAQRAANVALGHSPLTSLAESNPHLYENIQDMMFTAVRAYALDPDNDIDSSFNEAFDRMEDGPHKDKAKLAYILAISGEQHNLLRTANEWTNQQRTDIEIYNAISSSDNIVNDGRFQAKAFEPVTVHQFDSSTPQGRDNRAGVFNSDHNVMLDTEEYVADIVDVFTNPQTDKQKAALAAIADPNMNRSERHKVVKNLLTDLDITARDQDITAIINELDPELSGSDESPQRWKDISRDLVINTAMTSESWRSTYESFQTSTLQYSVDNPEALEDPNGLAYNLVQAGPEALFMLKDLGVEVNNIGNAIDQMEALGLRIVSGKDMSIFAPAENFDEKSRSSLLGQGDLKIVLQPEVEKSLEALRDVVKPQGDDSRVNPVYPIVDLMMQGDMTNRELKEAFKSTGVDVSNFFGFGVTVTPRRLAVVAAMFQAGVSPETINAMRPGAGSNIPVSVNQEGQLIVDFSKTKAGIDDVILPKEFLDLMQVDSTLKPPKLTEPQALREKTYKQTYNEMVKLQQKVKDAEEKFRQGQSMNMDQEKLRAGHEAKMAELKRAIAQVKEKL